MSDSFVRRFLFEHLDIRGAIVHLGDSWQQMQVDRDYQPTVAQLLVETQRVGERRPCRRVRRQLEQAA